MREHVAQLAQRISGALGTAGSRSGSDSIAPVFQHHVRRAVRAERDVCVRLQHGGGRRGGASKPEQLADPREQPLHAIAPVRSTGCIGEQLEHGAFVARLHGLDPAARREARVGQGLRGAGQQRQGRK